MTGTSSTVYNGGLHQVLGIYSTPQALEVTNLNYGSIYGMRVTPYRKCRSKYVRGTSSTIQLAQTGNTNACIPSAPSNHDIVTNNLTELTLNSWSAPSSGAYTGFVTRISTTNSFPTLVESPSLPTADLTYGGSGVQAVYVGSSNSPNQTITGLHSGTTYYIKTVAYYNCDGYYVFENTGVTSTHVVCEGSPTASSSVLSLNNVGTDSLNIASIGPVSSATGYIVLANTINSFTAPENGSLPVANTTYSGSGEQVVYAGTSSTPNVYVSGLSNTDGGETYYFKSYAYNQCGTNYFYETTGVTASATTLGAVQTVASNAKTGEVGASFIDLNSFTGAVGATGHVIKINTSNSFSVPTDANSSLPTANLSYAGGEQIVYAGTSTSPDIKITGLSENTTYYFSIYAYSEIGGRLYYNQTGYSFSQLNFKPTSSITFAGIGKTYGDVDFTLAATSNSTGDISYSIVSQTNGGTSIIGNTCTVGNAGVVTIQATQAADANYNGNTVQAILTIGKASPVLDFSSVTVSFGAENQTLTATPVVVGSAVSASTGAISYTIEGNAPTGNSISGTTWIPGDAGSFTIRASIAADANYNAGFVDANFTVGAPAEMYFVTSSKLLSLRASGLDTLIDFTTNSASTGNVPFEVYYFGGKLWGTGTQGGANGKGTLFTINPDGTAYQKIHDFTATASSTALPLHLSLINGQVWGVNTSGGLGISGTGIGYGEVFRVDLDGSNFTTVKQFDPNVSPFYQPYGELVVYNNRIYGYTSGAGGGVFSFALDGTDYTEEYTFQSSPVNEQYPSYTGFTLFNNWLWFSSQFHLMAWDPATKTVVRHISILNNTQPTVKDGKLFVSSENTISEVTAPNYNSLFTLYNMASGTFTNANSLFNGPLSSDDTRLYGSSINDAGNSTIYSILPDGTDIRQEFVSTGIEAFYGRISRLVEKLTPSLSFSDQTIHHLHEYVLDATTNSSSGITYSIVSQTGGGTTLSNDTLIAGNVGTVTVRASINEDPNYLAATHDVTFTIQKATPEVTYTAITTDVASAAITLTPTSSNYTGGTITYAFVDPNDISVTATSGYTTGSGLTTDQLTVGTPGAETIRAYFPSTANFNADSVDFNLTIGNATADLSSFVNFSKEFFSQDDTLEVTSASNVAVSYSLLTSNTGTSLSGTNNEILKVGNVAGTETIRVTVTETNYITTTKDVTLTVERARPIITWATPSDIQFFVEPFDTSRLNATANVPGIFTYWLDEADFGTEIIAGTTTLSQMGSQVLVAQFTPTDHVNYQEVTYNTSINAVEIDLEITIDDKFIKAGDPEPALTYTITKGATFVSCCNTSASHTLFFPMARQAGTTVGTYNITVDNTVQSPQDDGESAGAICPTGLCIFGEGNMGLVATQMHQYNITIIPGVLTISNKAIVMETDIVFTPPASLVYDGSAKTHIVTADDGLNPALPSGDVDLAYSGRNGTVYPSSTTAPTNVGDYTVTATVNERNADYEGSLSSDFSISPAPVTIKANAVSKVYDKLSSTPELSFFVLSGSIVNAADSTSLLSSMNRGSNENVGKYQIDTSNIPLAFNTNYDLTYLTDSLTINQRPISVSGENISKTYGDGDPIFEPTIVSGSLLLGDAFSGSLTRNLGDGLGEYFITQGTLTAGANYAITFLPSSKLTISARPITLTADAKSKTYGDADPSFTYQVTTGSLVSGDAFTGSLSRTAGDTVGTFTITQGNLSIDQIENYNLSFVSNDLTINKRNIGDISYADTSTVYGTVVVPRVVITGGRSLVEGHKIQYVAGTPSATYFVGVNTAFIQFLNTTTENIFPQPWYPSVFTATGENVSRFYTSTGISAQYQLTVSARPITITADAKTKVYGETDPSLTYQVTTGSLVGSDALSGSLSRAAGENVNTYAITQGTLANTNYSITYASANLSITKATLTVTAVDTIMEQGATVPTFRATYAGFKGADNESMLDTKPSISSPASSASTVGDYPIFLNGGLDNNYNFSLRDGTLTIIASPSITAATLVDKIGGAAIAPNHAYRLQDSIWVEVTYDKKISVVGQARIQLTSLSNKYAVFDSLVSPDSLKAYFLYEISTDEDRAGLSDPNVPLTIASSIHLNGGSIKDQYGFNASLDISGLTVPTGTITDAYNSLAELDDLSLYPIPFKNSFVIELPFSAYGDYQMTILDQSGKVLVVKELSATTLTYEVHEMQRYGAGLYLVQLSKGNVIKSYRIIKQ